MNKYLAGFLNLLIALVIGFVGLLFSLNIFVAGLILYPLVVVRVDQYMISSPMWLAQFVPSTLPLFVLLTVLAITVLPMFITLKLIKKADSERIIEAIQKWLQGKEGGKIDE